MRRPDRTGLALLILFAGLACGDSHSAKMSRDMQPAVHTAGTGGHVSTASNPTGTGGHVSTANDDTSSGGSNGTGGSHAPSERDTCGCGQGTVTLECACGPKGCDPVADGYDGRLKAALDCSHPTPWFDPQWSPVWRGCGLISISIGNGVVGTIRVYRESDHELVGASTYSDAGDGCETDNVDLTSCPDYSTCLPCADGINGIDMCPDWAESDGGS